jgi:diguanylate cyclase (GGDEF)-like protein
MLLDLDHFKEVNDRLGHATGDELLIDAGGRLMSLLRESDTVARMGGDEFMLILPGLARWEDAAEIAQRILEAFRRPFATSDHELRITTSIGIAIYPDEGEDMALLMRSADTALYRAKQRGRDNFQRYFPA